MYFRVKYFLAVLGIGLVSSIQAGVPKNLKYIVGTPKADEIAEQVYFVNHFYAFSKLSVAQHPRGIAVVVNASPGKKPRKQVIERHMNNAFNDGVIKSKEIAIVRGGKNKSTGMLIVEYEDNAKSHDHFVWLPQLRKIKRFTQPADADSWAGTHFTYGDLTLRKPEHESHEVLGSTKFNGCLNYLNIETPDNEIASILPGPSCIANSKDVYRLKSTTKHKDWWYDYRISYVDRKTFADYRTEYFKDGNLIKVIDRDWRSMDMDDPRAQYWAYSYVKDLRDQHESEIIVPRAALKHNHDKDPEFWSLKTLRQLNR